MSAEFASDKLDELRLYQARFSLILGFHSAEYDKRPIDLQRIEELTERLNGARKQVAEAKKIWLEAKRAAAVQQHLETVASFCGFY